MIQYAVLHRGPGTLEIYFGDVTEFLVKEFKSVDCDYIGRFYDIALVPASISQPIETRMPDSSKQILQWHWAKDIPIKEIRQRYDLSLDDAFSFVKNHVDPLGAIHFDILTPFDQNEIGNKGADDKGLLEMNVLQTRLVIPHLGQPKDLYIIERLRKRL